MDVAAEITATERVVGTRPQNGKEAKVATITRVYPTDQKDLWDACTNPERIPRWFLPVTGDLRLGGTYQLVGNAGGTVTACEAPESFHLTWEMNGGVSWVEVVLAPVDAEHTRFQLTHIAHVDDDAMWREYGPAAVGMGWDMMLYGLTLHLVARQETVDPAAAMAWFGSPEGLDYLTRSSKGWGEAHAASGDGDPEDARAAAARCLVAYTATEEPPADPDA